MDQNPNAPPLNPLPPIVWVLALPLVGIELVLALAKAELVGGPQGAGWRLWAVDRFAVYPELLHRQWETGGYPLEELHRLISYPLVHGTFTQTLFAVVMLLALGKMVGEIFRWWAVLAVVLGASIAGALAYGFLVPDLRAPLFGAYPPVYGLIGTFTFLLWVNLARTGANKYRAFTLIGFLLFAQLVFGLIFGSSWDWVADITGFAAGFFLSFIVSPGGWARVKDKIRQR